MPDNNATGMNGAPWPRQPLSGGKRERLTAAREPAVDGGTQLAGLATRQFRHRPGSGWSRFLVAHMRWILCFTVVAVAAGAAVAHAQTPLYAAQADVDVWFASPDPTALQGPNMVTEKGIVSSGVVLAIAAHSLGISRAELASGLSLNVPAGSSIMQVGYADPVPWVAQERAQVIAEAYVAYRTPKATTSGHGTTAPAQISSALRATLITPASLPSSPSSPNYLVDVFAALVLGLGLGIATAALRDHLDDRIRGPFDLEARSGTPVLAMVPAFRPPSRRDPASKLVTVGNRGSVVAEAYRALRTRVIAAATARGARTLLITSPAWEDKGAVAANLAVALAQSGRRTILLCADLRWGNAHELLRVGGGEGLTTVLDRRTDLAEALCATSVRDLRVLPPGPLPGDPSELLQRPALRTVLGELRSHADFVVIDAPPVLATPDTVPLTQLAEMVLLVGDAKTTRAHLQAALREVEEVAGKLIGCVLAGVGRRRWLRGAAADPGTQSPDLTVWTQHDTVDGQEAMPSRRPAKNVSLSSGPWQ
jgi:tyrosine-protein kinase